MAKTTPTWTETEREVADARRALEAAHRGVAASRNHGPARVQAMRELHRARKAAVAARLRDEKARAEALRGLRAARAARLEGSK